MSLHRELGISQKAAWSMLQRLRKLYELEVGFFGTIIDQMTAIVAGMEKKRLTCEQLIADNGLS